MRGKYIVIEGAEGVGKTTQVKKLAEALRGIEIPVKVFREPDGESDITLQTIRKITQDPSYPMNSRTEVLLYNAARSQSLKKIKQAKADGFVCLVDRSYLSTLAVQYYGRGDITDYERLNDIIEFAVGDMQPDLMVVLDAPVDVLTARKAQTGETERFDQLNSEFLERIRSGYLWEARQRNLPIVYAQGSADDVFKELWGLITPILALRGNHATPSKPMSVADIIQDIKTNEVSDAAESTEPDALSYEQIPTPVTFFVPPELNEDERAVYTGKLSQIIDGYAAMVKQLTAYLLGENAADMPSVATAIAERYLRACQPFAVLGERQLRPNIDDTVKALSDKLLPRNYSSVSEPVRLVGRTPRNELDSIGVVLYEHSDVSMSDIRALLEVLPYEAKSRLLNSDLGSEQADTLLRTVSYEWDMISSFTVYEAFTRLTGCEQAVLQAPSPRLGFDTPSIIDDAGLTDAYAACFDTSLELYSTLQASQQNRAAECAVLLGHQMRWSVTVTAEQLAKLAVVNDTFPEEIRAFVSTIFDVLASAHPLIAAAIYKNEE